MASTTPVRSIRSFFVGRMVGRAIGKRVVRLGRASSVGDGKARWLPMTAMLRTVYAPRRTNDFRLPQCGPDRPTAGCGEFHNRLTGGTRLDTLRKQIVTGFTDRRRHCGFPESKAVRRATKSSAWRSNGGARQPMAGRDAFCGRPGDG